MGITSAQWTRIASSERLSRSSQAASAVDRKVVIFGGEVVPRQPVDSRIDIVDIGNDYHSSVQTLDAPATAPSPRVGSPSTTLNDKIWLFSGRGGLEMKPVEEKGALWSYDLVRSAWTRIEPANSSAPYPADRSYHCIASDGSSSVFVHAGCPETGRLADLWKFDTNTHVWSELSAAPGPARGGASIAYLEGNLYRMNGFDGQHEQGGALDIYDIAKGTWHVEEYSADGVHGPEARSVATLLPVKVGGRAYLITAFGEHDPSSLGHAGAGKMLANAWAWDIQLSQWRKLEVAGNTPEGRGWFDADVVKTEAGDDEIFVHGGLNEKNERLGDIWLLRLA